MLLVRSYRSGMEITLGMSGVIPVFFPLGSP